MTNENPDYAKVCQIASGKQVRMAFERLGPILQFGDMLASDAAADRAKTLAAEQIAHLVEGWRYCASAFHAFLVHAEANAQHFAYYAELRAALSLFSGSGIRVQRDDKYCLDEYGERGDIKVKGKTHNLVWGLWPEWVKRDDAAALLKQITLMPGVSITDIEESLSSLNIDRSLDGWGYDFVQMGREDHKERNTASYDGFWANRPLARMAPDNLELLRQLWELLLPDNDRWRFDIELIRFLVWRASGTLNQVRSEEESEDGADDCFAVLAADDKVLEEVVNKVASRCGADTEILQKTLTTAPLIRPFQEAEKNETAPANMICRAVFLLRLATLSVRENVQATGKAAQAWLAHWLEHVGLWSTRTEVDFLDLADDWRLALDDIKPEEPLPQTLWREGNAHHSARLCRPEVCIAWGVLA